MRSFAFALAALGSIAQAQPVASTDIVGLQLGQSPTQVEAALKQVAPGIRIGKVMWRDSRGAVSSLAALHGTVGRNGGYGYVSTDFDEYLQAGFGEATQKAYLVIRRWGSLYRSPTSMQQLEKSLLEKYGKPHRQSPGQMSWFFKANGAPATPADRCERGELIGQGVYEIQQPPSTACGFTMSVLFSESPREPGKVFVFSMGMYDHRLAVEDIKAVQARAAGADARAREKNEAEGAANKPRL